MTVESSQEPSTGAIPLTGTVSHNPSEYVHASGLTDLSVSSSLGLSLFNASSNQHIAQTSGVHNTLVSCKTMLEPHSSIEPESTEKNVLFQPLSNASQLSYSRISTLKRKLERNADIAKEIVSDSETRLHSENNNGDERLAPAEDSQDQGAEETEMSHGVINVRSQVQSSVIPVGPIIDHDEKPIVRWFKGCLRILCTD